MFWGDESHASESGAMSHTKCRRIRKGFRRRAAELRPLTYRRASRSAPDLSNSDAVQNGRRRRSAACAWPSICRRNPGNVGAANPTGEPVMCQDTHRLLQKRYGVVFAPRTSRNFKDAATVISDTNWHKRNPDTCPTRERVPPPPEKDAWSSIRAFVARMAP